MRYSSNISFGHLGAINRASLTLLPHLLFLWGERRVNVCLWLVSLTLKFLSERSLELTLSHTFQLALAIMSPFIQLLARKEIGI